MTSSTDDPRIEEMTADQPAIRADERARIAAEIEAQAATWDDKAVGMSSDTASSIRLGAALIRSVAALVRGKSAAASSLPGLSVCVAQLAAIRQLANAARWMTLPDNSGDLYPAVYVSELLTVLDGVPGTQEMPAADCGKRVDGIPCALSPDHPGPHRCPIGPS